MSPGYHLSPVEVVLLQESGEPFWKKWNWFLEWTSPNEIVMRSVKGVVAWRRTEFQDVSVVDVEELGRSLIIDGKVQSSLLDEHVYHESLVHPAMVAHGSPRRVLVLGGGEGATLREVLRYRSVEEAVMVDLDRGVVEFAREHLGEWHQGAFDDPRARLVFDDGRRFVEEALRRGESFDVVIADLVDPLEGGPALKLYTREFYEMIASLIGDRGVFVTQATSPMFYPEVYYSIHSTLASVFKITRPYVACVRSFNGLWGFVLASQTRDPRRLSGDDVDRLLKEQMGGEGFEKLRYYDGETHVMLMSLPRDIRRELGKEWPVSTDEKPAYGTH